MPRSPSPLTNSDASDMSDSAAIVDDTEDDPAPAQPRDSLRELEERQAAEEAQLRASRARAQREKRTILECVVCQALREICFFYLARQLHMEFPDRRQSGAKISAHRRRLEQLEPGDIHAAITPLLEDWVAEQLDRDYTIFAGYYDRQMPANDAAWLEQVGQSGAPPRHVAIQHLARIARPRLRAELDPGLADFLAPWMADQTQHLLYTTTVYVLLPLLGSDGRRQFQHWYYGYSETTTEVQEGASGSSDPPRYLPPTS